MNLFCCYLKQYIHFHQMVSIIIIIYHKNRCMPYVYKLKKITLHFWNLIMSIGHNLSSKTKATAHEWPQPTKETKQFLHTLRGDRIDWLGYCSAVKDNIWVNTRVSYKSKSNEKRKRIGLLYKNTYSLHTKIKGSLLFFFTIKKICRSFQLQNVNCVILNYKNLTNRRYQIFTSQMQ